MNSNINYNSNYCLYRLPCGYCKELGRDCPKVCTMSTTPTITLTNAYTGQPIMDYDETLSKKEMK